MNIGPVLRDEVLDFLLEVSFLQNGKRLQLAAQMCSMADDFETSIERLYWTYRALNDAEALKQIFLRRKGHIKPGE
jgi:hypothetical protein